MKQVEVLFAAGALDVAQVINVTYAITIYHIDRGL